MATPVASNQLVTPRDLAQEGIWTNPSNTFLNMRDSSSVNTIAQTLATNAWGSSTNYNTRIMTRQDIINTGVAAQNNITGYSTNQCPPFGPLYNYNNDSFYSSFPALNWGSAYLNTSYPNYGYVDIYLYSPYYRLWSWNTDRDGYNLNLICWNGSSPAVGVKNCYIGDALGFGGGCDTLGEYTDSGKHFRVLDWDGNWAHLASIPWYDNANGLATSSCYLTLAAVTGYGRIYDRANEYVTYSTPAKSTELTTLAGGTEIYVLDQEKLYYNGQRISFYIS